MKFSFLLILATFLVTTSAFGYSWTKCNTGSPGANLISTTQFSSSWGNCSALGMNERDKDKFFITQNLEFIRSDSARGGGEYLAAFAVETGCGSVISHFERTTQANFEAIYGKDSQNSPKEAYESIRSVIDSDPVLNQGCKSII